MEGNVEDHALLLCNLLLGWGLDAWVATGTIYSAPKPNSGSKSSGKPVTVNIKTHTWVITLDKVDTKHTKVIMWESLTGNQFEFTYNDGIIFFYNYFPKIIVYYLFNAAKFD